MATKPKATPASVRLSAEPSQARGEERLDDIRRIVLELVADRGIEGVTIDAIANAAQASKQTLYNRWPTKDALIIDAIRTSFEGGQPGDPGDIGSLREELRLILDSAAGMLTTNHRLIVALLDAAQRDATVMALMREQTRDNFRDVLQQPLKRAIARGEIGPETNLNLIPDIALPALLHRAMWNELIDERTIAFLVDEVLLRLVHRPAKPAT